MIDTLNKLTDLSEEDVRGRVVLVRAGFNVPVTDGKIDNDFRIRRVLPTVAWLTSRGAKVVLLSHIWGDETTSLKVVHEYLSRHMPVTFIPDITADEARESIASLGEGEVALAENLRLHDGEQANDSSFAQELASLGDIYVNEAFSVSHREHASIVGIPRHIPSYAGLQLIEEVGSLSHAFEPDHPFVFILGGAKFETKVPVISKFLGEADSVYVTGALANVYIEARGYEVGDSLMPSDEMLELGTAAEDERLHIPADVVSLREEGEVVKVVQELDEGDNQQDIGPQTLAAIKQAVQDAAFVVWNGPVGNYEKGFSETTQQVAQAIARSDATSIIGGGDTLAVIAGMGLEDEFSFVSTGGGAMLLFLLNETLPGLEVLRKN